MKIKLDNRMKQYEYVTRNYLTRRTPVIVRLDGKAFHSFTKKLDKPFDGIFIEAMWEAATTLCENIQGCKIAYVQSDEISILITDYEKIHTCAYFDYNVQKICSITASIVTLAFNNAFEHVSNTKMMKGEISQEDYYNIYYPKRFKAMFDSRVFNIPKEEVCNYFIWRQKDAERNSIQMIGRSEFSHNQLNKKSNNDIQDMLFIEKNINWNNFPIFKKRGACLIKKSYKLNNDKGTVRAKWIVDKEIPIFTKDRKYIEKYI